MQPTTKQNWAYPCFGWYLIAPHWLICFLYQCESHNARHRHSPSHHAKNVNHPMQSSQYVPVIIWGWANTHGSFSGRWVSRVGSWVSTKHGSFSGSIFILPEGGKTVQPPRSPLNKNTHKIKKKTTCSNIFCVWKLGFYRLGKCEHENHETTRNRVV